MKLFNRLIVSAKERRSAAEVQLLLPKERSQRMLRHNCQLLKSISLTVLLFVFNSILFHICHFPFFYILLCFIIGQSRELLKRNSLLVFLFAHSCSTGPCLRDTFRTAGRLHELRQFPRKGPLTISLTVNLFQLSPSFLVCLNS